VTVGEDISAGKIMPTMPRARRSTIAIAKARFIWRSIAKIRPGEAGPDFIVLV
jgi:hypothetical protein